MNRFIDFKSENDKNKLFSARRYIAAGAAAAFVLCAVIGSAAADSEDLTEKVCADAVTVSGSDTHSDGERFVSRDLDVFAAASFKRTVNVSSAAYSKGNDDSDCEGVNTSDALVSDTGIRASVDELFARSSEKGSVRAVEPEMSPYRDDAYEDYSIYDLYYETRTPYDGNMNAEEQDGDDTGAEEDEAEWDEADGEAITDGEEIFADDESDQGEAYGISKFKVPDWLRLDENGIPLEYDKAIEGESCAYTAEPDALMSTGKEVFQGYVAVDPDIIPYGSELYIIAEDGEVYGYAIAADTGYSVREGHIIVDLFMDEYDDCIQWGRKDVTVYILRTGENE